MFYDGKLSGKGKYIWIDGKSFEGDWVDSLIEGSGKYCYIDGRVYEGEFQNGKKHG